MHFDADVLVVGAGTAGLACAQVLTGAGRHVVLLERSGSAGGRVATKPLSPGGVALDYGPIFAHGDDPEFLALLRGLPGLVAGWPQRVEGRGLPCQPAAFEPGQERYGLTEGLAALTESLAEGLTVLTGTTVTALERGPEGFQVTSAVGRVYRSSHVVLALALEQAEPLIRSEEPGAAALLRSFGSLPSLTVLATYADPVAGLPFDVWYPEASTSLLLVANEATKRPLPPGTTAALVVQARPAWSQARLEAERDGWARELLAETARHWGAWIAAPRDLRAHRWKYARLSPSDHLTGPLLLPGPGSTALLGLAGDLFDPAGGIQGAWRSGRALAHRLLERGV